MTRYAVTTHPAMSEVVTANPGMYLGAVLDGQIYEPLGGIY
jgi:hypothetical protein